MGWLDRVSALLGISAYAPPVRAGARSLGDSEVERARRAFGGQLQLPTTPQTRWYMAQLEQAEYEADQGLLAMAARLVRAARSDAIVSGVLKTRTSFVRLPRWFRGAAEITQALQLGNERSLFDEMCPPGELAELAADGVFLGVGVAELVPIEGRDYPLLVRLDPEFLRYVHMEDRWYYRTTVGDLPITPGDGRWVLHLPGGRRNPWQNGEWRPVGKAWIKKDHAGAGLENWESKLANPARVAVAPTAATDEQHDSWLEQIGSWGYNTVFTAKPGYDLKLLESNGRGADSFRETIKSSDQEVMIALAGQVVTTTGGTGFANADIHAAVAGHLIASTEHALSYTISTQVLPAWIVERWGESALDEACVMGWDTTRPKDLEARARALQTAATAAVALTSLLSTDAKGPRLDVEALMTEFGVPLVREAVEERPKLRLVREGAA
jgi:hypothetical protein